MVFFGIGMVKEEWIIFFFQDSEAVEMTEIIVSFAIDYIILFIALLQGIICLSYDSNRYARGLKLNN